MELSEHARAILDFEREAVALPGPKEPAIRARFAVSPSSYYRSLRALLDDPAAFAYDPFTVKRLQRRLDQRRRLRHEGRRADPNSR